MSSTENYMLFIEKSNIPQKLLEMWKDFNKKNNMLECSILEVIKYIVDVNFFLYTIE